MPAQEGCRRVMKQLKLDDIKTERLGLIGVSTEILMKELRNRGIDVNLIEHHTKYKEIDGVDETIWVTHKQHRDIHRQWRNEGRVIPTEVCRAAAGRTEKCKMYIRKYQQRTDVKERTRNLRHKPERMEVFRKYIKENRQKIGFSERMMNNVHLVEQLQYNKKTGSLVYSSWFYAASGKQLYYLKE